MAAAHRRHAVTLPLLAVVGVAAALRLAVLDLDAFWLDEVSTAGASGLPFREMLAERARAGHPPLFFALTWLLTRVAGPAEWLLRLPAALAGIASVPLLYRLVGRLGQPRPPWIPLLAAALLAVDPLHLEMSRLARGYALVVLVGLATSLLILPRRPGAAGTGGARSLGRTAAFAGLWVLGLHVHYSALLVLATQLAWLAARRRWRFAAAGLAALASLGPWIAWSASVGHDTTANLGWLPPFSSWSVLFWLSGQWIDLDVRWLDPAFLAARWLVLVPILGLAAVGAAGAVRGDLRERGGALVPLLWLLPPALAAAAALADLNLLFKARYWATSAAVFPALVALGIAALPVGRRARAAVAAACLLLFTAGFALDLQQPEGTDWRTMARILEREMEPGEELLVLPDLDFRRITLRHYHRGPYRVLGEAPGGSSGRPGGDGQSGGAVPPGVWIALSPHAFEAVASRDPEAAEAAARELERLRQQLPVSREHRLRSGRLIHLRRGSNPGHLAAPES